MQGESKLQGIHLLWPSNELNSIITVLLKGWLWH